MEQNRQKLIDMINDIINKFNFNNAKIWNIGTNFYKSWIKIGEAIKNISFNENDNFYVIQSNIKNRYSLTLNEFNISPTVKKNKLASCGAIRQYLQVGSAFGFVEYVDGTKFENKDTKLLVLPKLFNLKRNPKEAILNQALFLLKNSYDHEIKYCKNLGFSLFISLIIKHDISLLNELENHKFFSIQKIKKLNTEFVNLHDKNGIKWLRRVYGDLPKSEGFGTSCHNYEDIAKFILDEYDFIDIIESIHKNINDSESNYQLIQKKLPNELKKTMLSLENKFNDIIQKNRSKLRNNIISNRFNKNNNTTFSDITNSSLNNGHLEFMDACHIYEIQQIKNDMLNEIHLNESKNWNEVLNKYINHAYNCNNGIMLSKCCHILFDKQIVWFDTSGYLRYRKECKEIVKKYFGDQLDNIQIKQDTFNEIMKHYLEKRYEINNN